MRNQAAKHSILQNILSSRQPGMVLLRYLFVGIVALAGLVLLGKFIYYTTLLVSGHLNTWMRDIYQYYLIGKAVVNGLSPYTSLDTLTTRFLGGNYVLHPAPYPPPFVLLSLPFGLLSFPQMVVTWGLVQFICIVWIAVSLQRWLGRKVNWALTGLIFLLLTCWYPIVDDLILGNVMIILLAFLAGAWLALRDGKQLQGGLLLGFVISIKLVGWLFLPYLLFKKQWRLLFTVLAVVLLSNLVAGLFLGFDQVLFYYRQAGSQTWRCTRLRRRIIRFGR